MIDDVTSPFPPSPSSLASLAASLPPPSSLSLSLSALCCLLALSLAILLSLSLYLSDSLSLSTTSRGSNPPQAEHRTGGDAQSSVVPSLAYSHPLPLPRHTRPLARCLSFVLSLRSASPPSPAVSRSLRAISIRCLS